LDGGAGTAASPPHAASSTLPPTPGGGLLVACPRTAAAAGCIAVPTTARLADAATPDGGAPLRRPSTSLGGGGGGALAAHVVGAPSPAALWLSDAATAAVVAARTAALPLGTTSGGRATAFAGPGVGSARMRSPALAAGTGSASALGETGELSRVPHLDAAPTSPPPTLPLPWPAAAPLVAAAVPSDGKDGAGSAGGRGAAGGPILSVHKSGSVGEGNESLTNPIAPLRHQMVGVPQRHAILTMRGCSTGGPVACE